MKNLFHWQQAQGVKFLWQGTPEMGEAPAEAPVAAQENSLDAAVDDFLREFVTLPEGTHDNVKESIISLAGPDGLVDKKELAAIEDELKILIDGNPVGGSGGTVDLNIAGTRTIERTQKTKSLKETDPEKYLDLTTPFVDEASVLMKQNPSYYLAGDGNIVINGKPCATCLEGLERVQMAGTERVKNDFHKLDVSSAEELYDIVQASYARENSGVENPNFTKENAQDLFNYKVEGKAVAGDGSYKLDAKNAAGEATSSEVEYQQALLALANGALEGTLVGNSVAEQGADGQDGYATIEARRRFCALVNKAKYDTPQYGSVVETTQKVEISLIPDSEIVKLMRDPGRTLFLEDRSGSMSKDVKLMRGTIHKVIQEIKNPDVAFARIEGGDREQGFATAINQIPDVFDKEVAGNKIMMYSDELQTSTPRELRKFKAICEEYDVKTYLLFINPKQPGVMKQVDMTEMNADELLAFTKQNNEMKEDRVAYQSLEETAIAMDAAPESPEFNTLVKNVQSLGRSIKRAQEAGNVGDFNSSLTRIRFKLKKIQESPVENASKGAMLRQYVDDLEGLMKNEDIGQYRYADELKQALLTVMPKGQDKILNYTAEK